MFCNNNLPPSSLDKPLEFLRSLNKAKLVFVKGKMNLELGRLVSFDLLSTLSPGRGLKEDR